MQLGNMNCFYITTYFHRKWNRQNYVISGRGVPCGVVACRGRHFAVHAPDLKSAEPQNASNPG